MSAEDLDNLISYEQLEDIEDDFEDVELELREYRLCAASCDVPCATYQSGWREERLA
jgi:hypothetical protein